MFLHVRILDELYYLGVCARAGVITLEPPGTTLEIVKGVARYGALGGSLAGAAAKHPDRVAVIDEKGSMTYAEFDRRVNAVANEWRSRGLRAGDGVAILARNHRGFLEAAFAAARVGAKAIFLNTDFAGPQIREVAEREGTKLLVHDAEYAAFLEGVEPPLGRLPAEALPDGGDTSAPRKPEKSGSIIILTSGTTGTPKGAQRESPNSLAPIGALLSKVPFRGNETTVIGAPLFHALGFAHAVLGIVLGSTLVMRRKFDPKLALEDLEKHRASALIVVPVMLRKMLDAGTPPRLPHLRIVFVAGSQLGAELCVRTTKAFGPVVYNLYGSTEVAYATIATPEDLAAEPACVGRVPRGARVRILDDHGRDVPAGTTGRIFVGNAMPFEGYTGGGGKEIIDGLLSSGDVGHFDAAGRLFIDGRDDDMIVSGGENVFPGEIEELLLHHEAIRDAAVLGVPDDQWGQRLRAFVVLHDGAELSEEEVKTYVRENLARYKVPREVVFLGELPRNPTGKVLKRELAGT